MDDFTVMCNRHFTKREISSKQYALEVSDVVDNAVEQMLAVICCSIPSEHMSEDFDYSLVTNGWIRDYVSRKFDIARIRDLVIEELEGACLDVIPDGRDW